MDTTNVVARFNTHVEPVLQQLMNAGLNRREAILQHRGDDVIRAYRFAQAKKPEWMIAGKEDSHCKSWRAINLSTARHWHATDRQTLKRSGLDIKDWLSGTFPDLSQLHGCMSLIVSPEKRDRVFNALTLQHPAIVHSLFRCDECGHIEWLESSHHSSQRGNHFCEHCTDDYLYSEQMDDWLHQDDALPFYASVRDYRRNQCDHITRDFYHHSSSISYHEGAFFDEETYYDLGFGSHDDDDDDNRDDDEDDEDLNFIGEYHSSKHLVGHIPSRYDTEKPRLLLGLELEVEVNYEQPRDPEAENVLTYLKRTSNGYRYAACEQDASLDHGFEIVTSYTGLDVHEAMLKRWLASDTLDNLSADDTNTCGLHVHIDKAGITPLHKGKLLVFINSEANRPLIEAIARRYSTTGYGQIKPKTLLDGRARYQDQRYEALNFENPNTIEFRIFRSSLDLEAIMAALQFTRAAWRFTRQASIRALNADAFVRWINQPAEAKETHYLRPYLAEFGFVDVAEKTNNKPTLTLAYSAPAASLPVRANKPLVILDREDQHECLALAA